MKNKKLAKLFSLLLAGTLLFSACGKDDDDGGGNVPTEDVNDLEICVMDAGYRTEAFYALEEAFEKKYPEINVTVKPLTDINNKLTSELTRKGSTVDLWFAGEQNVISLVENSKNPPFVDLTDLLNETADGESVSLINKMNEQLKYYNSYVDENGKEHYYSISWVYGVCGIMYNANYLSEDQLPKTTNQLIALFEQIEQGKLAGCDTKPLIWSGSSGSSYMSYAIDTWKAQYMGVDNYNTMVNYFDGTNYTYEKLGDQGVIEAYKVAKALAKDKYFVDGSSGYQHTVAQQDFLRGEGVFMPNGDWIETEMKKAMENGNMSISADVRTLPTPIVSALGVKLKLAGASATEAQHEEMLIKVVTGIDEGKSNAELIAENAGLTDAKINAVREARKVAYSLGVSHRIYLPTTSNAKTAAKKFIKFFASDEGTAIFRKHAGSTTPFTMTNPPENEERSNFLKSQDKLIKDCIIIYNGITKSYIRAYNSITQDTGTWVDFVQNPNLEPKTQAEGFLNNVKGNWNNFKVMAGVQ